MSSVSLINQALHFQPDRTSNVHPVDQKLHFLESLPVHAKAAYFAKQESQAFADFADGNHGIVSGYGNVVALGYEVVAAWHTGLAALFE